MFGHRVSFAYYILSKNLWWNSINKAGVLGETVSSVTIQSPGLPRELWCTALKCGELGKIQGQMATEWATILGVAYKYEFVTQTSQFLVLAAREGNQGSLLLLIVSDRGTSIIFSVSLFPACGSTGPVQSMHYLLAGITAFFFFTLASSVPMLRVSSWSLVHILFLTFRDTFWGQNLDLQIICEYTCSPLSTRSLFQDYSGCLKCQTVPNAPFLPTQYTHSVMPFPSYLSTYCTLWL